MQSSGTQAPPKKNATTRKYVAAQISSLGLFLLNFDATLAGIARDVNIPPLSCCSNVKMSP
jgi:hypothetical protein